MNCNSISKLAAVSGLSAWLLIAVAGCQPNSSQPPPGFQPPGHAGHDHGHGHGDAGPHGGHIVEIGDEQLHAEWTHDDASGEVVVYLLDSTAEADAAIAAESILITTKIGDADQAYELAAAATEGGTSSKFSLTDPSLVEALKAVGPGIEATIVVQFNDEFLVGKFEAHSHAGHQH